MVGDRLYFVLFYNCHGLQAIYFLGDGLGTSSRVSTYQQLKLADETHLYRLLLPTSPVALMHLVESMGEGSLLGIERLVLALGF